MENPDINISTLELLLQANDTGDAFLQESWRGVACQGKCSCPFPSLQQGFWSSLGVQQRREEHCPPDSSGITQELIFAFPIQHHFLSLEQRSRKQSLLTTHCAATSPLPQDRKQQLDHFVCFLFFFFKQRKSHLPLEEVDSVNDIPAILAQVLLKLPQDISNPGCIVQVHLQRVLQEE